MRRVPQLAILSICFGLLAFACIAQQPKGKPSDKDGQANKSVADSIVARMMAFDKNKDGKLTRDEVTDERLLRFFDRADANKDGVVTKEELVALASKVADEEAASGGGRRGVFGLPGEQGGPGGRGPGGFGGPPQPGQIMPPFLQDMLKLTAQIVSAHIGKNEVAADALPSLIQAVYRSLATAETWKPRRRWRRPSRSRSLCSRTTSSVSMTGRSSRCSSGICRPATG